MTLKEFEQSEIFKITLVNYKIGYNTIQLSLQAILHLSDNYISYQVLHYKPSINTKWTVEREFFVLIDTKNGQEALDVYEDARNMLMEEGVS